MDYIYVTLRRYIELILLIAALSAILAFFYLIGLIASDSMLQISLFLMSMAFIVINVILLRRCFVDLLDIRLYYLSNFSAYFLFILTSVILYFVLPSAAFAWVFGVTKFLRYSDLGISTFGSLLIFHALGLLITAVASAGLGHVLTDEPVYEGEDFLYDEGYADMFEDVDNNQSNDEK